jgi:putative addiction module killer protein
MVEIREFLDARDANPYRVWFDGLNPLAAAKVATTLTRLALGNFSNVKSVGSAVFELKIHFGPG